MVIAEYLRDRMRKTREKREQEQRDKVRVERDDQWLAWLKRRDEAEKNNLPFDEPPPSLEDSANGGAS